MRRCRLPLAVVSVSVLACAAGDGTQVPVRDAGSAARDVGTARDTGVRRDAPAAVDRPAVAMDVPAVAEDVPVVAMDVPVVAMDVPVVEVDRPLPVDLGAPVDLGRDVGSITLGDAWSPERDAGDPTPRDVDRVVGGAPADSAARFGGADDPARAPSIVYPEDGTLLPPNLTGFEVHFRPGAGNDLFEVSLRGDRGALRVFTRCAVVADGCVLSLDEPAYAELARVAQPSGAVVLAVRATSAGGGVGRSATRSLGVTNFDVRGGLYYWTASSGSINRYEFGRAGARTEPFLRGDPINCIGCHVLSRDGSRIMAGRFIPGPAATRLFDVTTRAPLSPDYGANFGSFSPDVRWLLTSDGNRLALRDPVNGNEVPGLAPGTSGSHPDWARGGRSVVFARARTSIPFFGTPGHDGPAELLTMPWNGTSFGAATTLVRAEGTRNNNYYPSYSPDDAWVLFNRAAGNSNHNIDAQLWVVPASGGTPSRLARADLADATGNSWPKWAPFVQRFQGEPLMWFTFSSRRDYGLRLRQQTREAPMRTTQLWMAAFRPNRVAGGDASTPAFWLPFQSLSEGNHIAQWAEQVQRQGCSSDRDCVQAERCLPLANGAVATYRCVVP